MLLSNVSVEFRDDGLLKLHFAACLHVLMLVEVFLVVVSVKRYGIKHIFFHTQVIFVLVVIVVFLVFVWLIHWRKHIGWLISFPHFLFRLSDSCWSTHRWWILRPVLIPWRMCLVRWILLVGLVVWPSVPLLPTGVFSCRYKWDRLYTLSLWVKDDLDLAGVKPWYYLPLG